MQPSVLIAVLWGRQSCLPPAFKPALLSLLPALCLAATPTYNDVAAIFSARCLGCHADEVRMGSLNLETWDGVQQGGTHKIIVAGKSADSRLYQLISGKTMPSMPMDGSKLSPEQIDTIRAWIDAGAPGPAKGEPAPTTKTAALPKIEPRVPVKPQIFDLASSPDGRVLALAGYREVRLLDAATRQQLATLAGHASTVRALVFSRDGRLLAAAGDLPARSGEVRSWAVAERKLLHTFPAHSDCIHP